MSGTKTSTVCITYARINSTQVLGEFFVAIVKKLAAPLTAAEVLERVHHYLLGWKVLDVTGLIVLEAARGVQAHNFSFWDAQIWATARLNQIPLVFSEDFNPDSVVDGIRFVNPFSPTFDQLPKSRTT